MLSESDPLDSFSLSRSSSDNDNVGRFDNIPFKWDYSFSTDTALSESDGLFIYPVEPFDEDNTEGNNINTFSTNGGSAPGSGTHPRTDGGTTRPGNNGNPGGSTSGTGTYTDQMLIVDPNIVYVGAAFPKSTFAKDFSKELLYPRNPIDIYTNFPDPYISEITKETGAIGYKKFLKEVIRSDEYKDFVQGGGREGLDFQCTEIFSYSDIEKALASNAGFAQIFSAKVQVNSKKTNIKSRLFAQLVSKNFTVTMDLPSNGFFKDKSNDTLAIDPVYIRSLTYGKVAVMAVESEYTFEEVKKAVEAGIKYSIFSGGAELSVKDKEIIQKSTITICAISDESNVSQYFDSFEKIKDIFKVAYSENHYGLPIFCKGYFTKDNSIFTVSTKTGGHRGRP